jgi:sulfate adenylyltransferase subunit 2
MLTHLQRLEAESIHIMREVVAECERPVMLYSIGKDSAVMLHLAMKAFYPARRRFRCCTWTPPGSSERCTRIARPDTRKKLGMELLVHQNPEGWPRASTRSTHGSAVHTDLWKTEG